MEHIKQNFSIKDLEHLSGIKAHTIRIWEKRYNILTPERTDTNIRTYDISNLQKILNVTFLNEHGYKISRIAKLSDEEISSMVKNVAATASLQNRAINSFKVAMINFDESLFSKTYNKLLETKTFRQIFHEIFLPLLEEVGLLWQTDTLNPVHEHFIVDLIKHKLYFNIALLKENIQYTDEKLYVLFLPENEIHDLGLLYINYELLLSGRKTIFLGPSMPLKEMRYILEIHPDPAFISYLTITPRDIDEFITEFKTELCTDKIRKLNLFGAKIQNLDPSNQPEYIKIYKSITEFTNELE
ncbi:MerR family transcriptional regulator [Antarcticibacterium sp. 1MA-6-2]|uniref:MerR family transcriptional regulator n=1 Tax=Antarcticibacterium sp. 1MA-6-2 TaxID=2908210 RepID=UPI001F278D76|nr:MerR family transcriptional regulator [Antarcticibacterium sp. 1MA-6-2]UJH91154.1 MerR family transcriptional regulator [Antarcticibacterium sp. 1MA-6-2]